MLNDEELKLVMMELETEALTLNSEFYRYQTKYGFHVLYYIFDIQKMENFIFEPIYLYTEDVEHLERSEDELFRLVLENTVVIMQTKVIPYSRYLAEFEAKCQGARLELIRRLVKAMDSVGDEKKLWCVTNSIRERGASGGFYTPLLKAFCMEHHYAQLLIGISNNDFAFMLSAEDEEAVSNMEILVKEISHVVENEEHITKRGILLYDYRTDTLKVFK